jgi:hypothetical protein
MIYEWQRDIGHRLYSVGSTPFITSQHLLLSCPIKHSKIAYALRLCVAGYVKDAKENTLSQKIINRLSGFRLIVTTYMTWDVQTHEHHALSLLHVKKFNCNQPQHTQIIPGMGQTKLPSSLALCIIGAYLSIDC